MATPKIIDESVTDEYKDYTLQARETCFYPSTDSIFVLHIWKGEESIGSAEKTFLTVADALHFGRNWVDAAIKGDFGKYIAILRNDTTVLDWLENV